MMHCLYIFNLIVQQEVKGIVHVCDKKNRSWNVKKASAQSNQGVDIDPELHFDNLESDKTYLFNLDTECFSIEFDETDTAYKRILQQREIIKQRRVEYETKTK